MILIRHLHVLAFANLRLTKAVYYVNKFYTLYTILFLNLFVFCLFSQQLLLFHHLFHFFGIFESVINRKLSMRKPLHDSQTASWNHFMMGQIDEWFFRSLAGIQMSDKYPGMKHFIIAPQPVGDLTSISAFTHFSFMLIPPIFDSSLEFRTV